MNNNMWENIALILDRLQSEVLHAPSTESLINQVYESDLPFDKKQLSIIYQGYGYSTLKPLAFEGRVFLNEKFKDELPFPTDKKSLIVEMINDSSKERVHLKTHSECKKNGFEIYKSILIVPMRLTEEKHTGVFILADRDSENSFIEFSQILDSFSNRIAHIIRHNVRKRRNESLQLIQTHLLSNTHNLEHEIIEEFINGIPEAGSKGISEWYSTDDKIQVLLKNPLNTKSFSVACKDGKVTENYFEKKLLPVNESNCINPSILQNLEDRPLIFNNSEEIKKNNIKVKCKSWIAVPMRLKNRESFKKNSIPIIGYLVLYNTKIENAYESGEAEYLDILSDFLGLIISQFRNYQFSSEVNSIRNFSIENEDHYKSIQFLCEQVSHSFRKLYGIKNLTIAYYNKSNMGFIPLYPEKDESNRFINSIKDQAFEIVLNSTKTRNNDYKKLTIEIDGLKYFIAPMRLEDRSIGCFIFKSENIGDFTAYSIDTIGDELGRKLNNFDRWYKYPLLTEYGISAAKSKALNQQQIIKHAYEAIGKIMFSDNFYIALFDAESNLISFPFARENGKIWKSLQGVSRELNSNKIGKTEEIILTEKPLFHRTKAESIEWYSQPNHQEFAGNPLASWVGAPIFSDKGVIGVIATYHDQLDYIYTERDVFFLQNIANQISGLFRSLELVKSQRKIVEYESNYTVAGLSHDLLHRSHNTFGSLHINISEAADIIDEAVSDKSTSGLNESKKYLNDALSEVSNLLGDIKDISSLKEEEVDLVALIDQIFNSVKTHKNKTDINLKLNQPQGNYSIKGIKRNIFNLIYSVIDNAADAIISDTRNHEQFIHIDLSKEPNKLVIKISDNGKPIPKNIRKHLFEYGSSSKDGTGGGYGLWRAKSLAQSLGGDISYSNSTVLSQQVKTFTISIESLEESYPICFVIDDEESWRNIVSRWMISKNYHVTTAQNKKEAMGLLSNTSEHSAPDIIFLDISFDRKNSFDTSGLEILQHIASLESTLNKKIKVVLLTGYSERATFHLDNIDYVMNKVSDDTPLTKKYFLETLAKQKII